MIRKSVPFAEAAGTATRPGSLIDELEAAFVDSDIGARADILRRVTDLFVTGSERFGA
jgi:hypothetical protein